MTSIRRPAALALVGLLTLSALTLSSCAEAPDEQQLEEQNEELNRQAPKVDEQTMPISPNETGTPKQQQKKQTTPGDGY